jgi:antitoxin component YwqK of YwqJK toxin-antitoxin module
MEGGGVQERFAENGQRTWRYQYKHGAPELYEAWWENGHRQYYQAFRDGLADGEWKVWSEGGELLASSVFRQGTGAEYYIKDGQLMRRDWKDGKAVSPPAPADPAATNPVRE